MHSPFVFSLLCLGLFQALVAGRPSACRSRPATAKAIYLLSNEKANVVVGLKITSDGKLSGGSVASTGGSGSNFIDGKTKKPAAPDALASQSALTVAGNNLFAVNAGSNTVTMFAIDQKDPTKLLMVGQPVAVPGEFPNTVAASQKNNLVCVGSSGSKSGISCASFTQKGMSAMDALRPISLQQTTPPSGPTNTISQAFFSNDEKTMFVTVKGDPDNKKTGFLAAYRTETTNGLTSLSQQGVNSSPNGTAVLFGSSTIPNSDDLFVTDASFGGAVLSIDSGSSTVALKGMATVDGQKATCWVTVSSATGSAFVTDVGTNRLVEMSLTDASIKGTMDLSGNGDPGLIDLKAAGKFIYALSPGNGTTQAAVTVVDAVKKTQVQHFQLQKFGAGKNAQGMAALL